MKELIYVSRAAGNLSDAEYFDLETTSIVNNTRNQITGVLFFDNRNFMQIIEGPKAAIDQVMARIHQDPRHDSIVVHSEGVKLERSFPDWHMAFSDLRDANQKMGIFSRRLDHAAIKSEAVNTAKMLFDMTFR